MAVSDGGFSTAVAKQYLAMLKGHLQCKLPGPCKLKELTSHVQAHPFTILKPAISDNEDRVKYVLELAPAGFYAVELSFLHTED